jgi:hypothetical protein
MTQFVEFTRFAAEDKKARQPVYRVSINVAHVTAVVAHPDGGTLLRFVGSGDNEHVNEDYGAVMRALNR